MKENNNYSLILVPLCRPLYRALITCYGHFANPFACINTTVLILMTLLIKVLSEKQKTSNFNNSTSHLVKSVLKIQLCIALFMIHC